MSEHVERLVKLGYDRALVTELVAHCTPANLCVWAERSGVQAFIVEAESIRNRYAAAHIRKERIAKAVRDMMALGLSEAAAKQAVTQALSL